MRHGEMLDFRNTNVSEADNPDIVLYYCGIQKCDPLHLNSRIRDFYVIHYVLSGRGSFTINNETFKLEKGCGFLISPGILTRYQADAEEPWSYCWFSFNGRKVRHFMEQLGLGNSSPLFTYTKDDSLERCVMNMIDAKHMTFERSFFLQSQMYLFFHKLAESREIHIFNRKAERVGELYVKKSIDFIEKNYSEKITIQELAKYIGINRKHLHRVFKNETGISPQTYLMNCRIDKSCGILRSSNISIGDVARSVGYEEPLMFSKMFKKRKNITPGQYRNLP